MKKSIRIGSGAGYAGDRIEPAIKLAEEGKLDYLVFECLAERTIALAQKEKSKNTNLGYNPLLEARMLACLPVCHRHNVKIITNMGAANPISAAKKTLEIARNIGIKDLTVAAVTGDDVLFLLDKGEYTLLENGESIDTIKSKILSANAYLGAEALVQALKNNADVVITGRVSDPSLFLAPMIHEFNWSMTNFEKLGKGTLFGHLLECAGQVCGGYFADSKSKQVPEIWDLGFPLVEMDENGEGVISKVIGTGGRITTATCTEQLLYEIHDPASYLTPDCIADFSKVTFKEIEIDQVIVNHATGRAPTNMLKVSIGYFNGFHGEGQISYGGHDSLDRAKLAGEIVKKRLEKIDIEELRIDYIGFNSLTTIPSPGNIPEVRLRVSGKTNSFELAKKIGEEVETLYTNGPAGGGGVTKKVEEVVSILSTLIPKSLVNPSVEYFKIQS